MKPIKEKTKLEIENFSAKIAGLNLDWKEKFKGTIDYEDYVLPKEKELIEDCLAKIIKIFKEEIEEPFNQCKIPCDCPKGGLIGKEERVCSKCGGSEWVLPKPLKDLLNKL